MDSEQFSEIMIKLDSEINSLCDDLYGAVKRGLPAGKLSVLLVKAKDQVTEYEDLENTLSGGKKAELQGYADEVDEIRDFIGKLEK